jgi:hypothetical protein
MRPLRAADLEPGACYYSPTGRLCMLLQPQTQGISRTSYLFAYLTKNRNPSEDEGFALNCENATAIAAMRPATLGGPITIPVSYSRGRGI